MEERAWYVVQTYSGYEDAVKRNLELRAESMNMKDKIFNVLVPVVKETEKTKKGDLKEVLVKLYPGYVFIDMIVTDDTWFMIRNTPMVTGFLGSSGGRAKPVPLPEDEVAPILKVCGISKVRDFDGDEGDKVKITAGTFAGQEAVIEAIDSQKGNVKVLIDFFGRKTSVELAYNEVELLK